MPDSTSTVSQRRSMRTFLGDIVEHRLYARAACAATLLLPIALLYTRAVGDILMSVVAVQFLLMQVARGDRTWTREPWVLLSALFLLWQAICTAIAGTAHGLVEALAIVRLFMFTAALEHWVLLYHRERQQLQRMILAIAAWIGVESWHQYLLGTNIFGVPRWGGDMLTGPLMGPRAGGTLQMVFFPAILPPTMHLLSRPHILARIAGVALPIVAVATMVLIGQRMPTVLTVFGLALSSLFLRRFRWPVAGAMLAGALLLAVTPIISPPTYARLVVLFSEQMQHFWDSPYGILFARAVAMVWAHPWIGLGFDGFRVHCGDPAYIGSPPWLGPHDTGEALGCSLHPHNYWLQVATSTGLPGLLMFTALAVAWLRAIGRDLFTARSPLRVALFVTAAMILWPIASTTSLFTVPNAGWVFLMIGWGLAEARDAPGRGASR